MSAAVVTKRQPGRDLSVMVGRSLRHTVRGVDALFVGLFLPVMIMLMLTTVFGGAMDTGGGAYVDYVAPGVILLCAGYGASLTAVSVTADVQEGIIERFRTMNLLPAAAVIGHVVASVLRNLVSVVLVVTTALLIGFRPRADLLDWLLIALVIVGFVLALSFVSAAIGLVAPSPEAAGAFGFVLLFLPYLSSAFVPVQTLPGWLQPVAAHQLFTPLTDTIRALLQGTSPGADLWIALAWCTALLAVGVLATITLWRRRRH